MLTTASSAGSRRVGNLFRAVTDVGSRIEAVRVLGEAVFTVISICSLLRGRSETKASYTDKEA